MWSELHLVPLPGSASAATKDPCVTLVRAFHGLTRYVMLILG